MMDNTAAHGEIDEMPPGEKAQTVERTFTAIALTYDRMNDLISLGTHRIAKRRVVEASGVVPGDRVLDLAGGTGDMTVRFGAITGDGGFVVLADRNRAMLDVAGRRLATSGLRGRAARVGADTLHLPFADGTFDCVAISFGVRNFTDIPGALLAVERVLRPGGTLVVLDFSKPPSRIIRAAFGWYLSRCVSLAARIVTGEDESYRYLALSVRMHPDQETLLGMMKTAGFQGCAYRNMMCGTLALHRGRKGAARHRRQ
jgi:demethylmenaquinone methyltransferase/2-methoxy-6-polyprenyl-1,4-benzoquinol methylase